jgi:hypothetical protein
MRIQTATCELCGTVVAADFLSIHVRFSHPKTIFTVELESKNQASTNSKAKLTQHQKKKSANSTVLLPQGKTTPLERKNVEARPVTDKSAALSGQDKSRFGAPRKEQSGNICILCGVFVPKGSMLEHKEKLHGENRYSQTAGNRSRRSIWVSIFQGGLPSLGKRNR